ncbi:MAG: hypothetical protein ACRDT0_27485 [Pseudonocardiaceae bacterium]
MTSTEPDLSGWLIGYMIGVPLTAVVAALVIAIFLTAMHIGTVAEDATLTLIEARDRTEALWQVETTNQVATDILNGAREARKALGG